VTYTEHAKRKTVTAMDVVYALKRQGRRDLDVRLSDKFQENHRPFSGPTYIKNKCYKKNISSRLFL